MLNQRSDALAESMLSTLTSAQQERLVTAMAEVHGLLSAAAIEISQVDPDQPDARRCMSACYAELDQRFLSGFDPAAGDSLEPGEMRTPAAILLVATLAKTAVGCGVLRFHSEGWAETEAPLGRQQHARTGDWSEAARGVGDPGCTTREPTLDTNRSLHEAIAMYCQTGYREVLAFNDNPYADWFEKHLDKPRT